MFGMIVAVSLPRDPIGPLADFFQFCRYIIGISLKTNLSLVTVTHLQCDRVQDDNFSISYKLMAGFSTKLNIIF